jgi:hypothetical protein
MMSMVIAEFECWAREQSAVARDAVFGVPPNTVPALQHRRNMQRISLMI